jgi:hypothetical protein
MYHTETARLCKGWAIQHMTVGLLMIDELVSIWKEMIMA